MTDALAPTVDVRQLGRLDAELGKGGQATVYGLRGQRSHLAYKRYKDGLPIDSASIDASIEWRRALSSTDRQYLDERCCWPQTRITAHGTTTGVVIDRAPDRFLTKLRSGKETLRELQFLFLVDRARKVGVQVPEARLRLQLVGELANLLDFFQDHRIVHGDISMKNVLWYWAPGEPLAVYLLDCDGARLAGQRPPLPLVTTPNWTDPRLIKNAIDVPDEQSDLYALALTYFRCYYGRMGTIDPDQRRLEVPRWPPATNDLMDLVTRSLGQRAVRPSAGDWSKAIDALEREIDDGSTSVAAIYQAGQTADRSSTDGPSARSRSAPPRQPATPAAKPATKPTRTPSPTPSRSTTSTPTPTGGDGPRVGVIVAGVVVGVVIAIIVLINVLGDQQTMRAPEPEPPLDTIETT